MRKRERSLEEPEAVPNVDSEACVKVYGRQGLVFGPSEVEEEPAEDLFEKYFTPEGSPNASEDESDGEDDKVEVVQKGEKDSGYVEYDPELHGVADDACSPRSILATLTLPRVPCGGEESLFAPPPSPVKIN